MTSLDERLKDEGYRGWLKTVMCLQFVRDGLVKFADKISQELHGNVLYKLQHYGRPAPNNLCPDTSFKKCTCGGNCKEVLIELKKHANNNGLELRNSDISQLSAKHWQSAKLFMNYGQVCTNIYPEKTDISGLLSFNINCKEAADRISDIQKVIKVRESRNTAIHSSSMEIKLAEFMTYTNDMIDLLVDQGNQTISPVCLSDELEAQQAVARIKEVQAASFVITKDDEMKAFKDLRDEIQKQAEDMCSEINDLRRIVSEHDSQTDEAISAMQEKINNKEEKMKTVQSSVEWMENALKPYRDQPDLLHTTVSSLKESIETMKKEFDLLRKTQEDMNTKHDQQIEDMKQEIKDVRTDVENLREGAQDRASPPTEADKDRLREYLKEGYKDQLDVPLPLRNYLNVSEVFEPVILKKDDLGKSQMSSRSNKWSSYKDIFYHGEIPQKQLFLQGKAGAGKTTFCKHLTDVWCNDTKTSQFHDPEVITRFRFVFYVSCKFANEKDSILDMIGNQLIDDDSMKNVAKYVLRNNPEDCLILVDGLDEWVCHPVTRSGRRGGIRGLPNRTGVENCIYLITTRPWRLADLPTELNSAYTVFELVGLDNVGELIIKILRKWNCTNPEESCSELLRQAQDCGMSEMINLPLILMIVLNTWTENQTLHKSLRQNYISMFKLLIQRAERSQPWAGDEKRLKEPLVHNIDFLKETWKTSFRSLPSCCQKIEPFVSFAKLIISLSHLSFELLFGEASAQQKLVFSKNDCKRYLNDEDLNVCLALGILTKSKTSRGIDKKESFSFIHKTFQEFLSALWLAGPGADSVGKIKEQIRNDMDLGTVLGDLNLLIKFLSGFVPEAGADIILHIYNQCRKHVYKYYGDFRDLVLTCSEESQHCNNTDDVQFNLPGIIIKRSVSVDMLTDILKSPPSSLSLLHITDLSLDHSIDKFYQSVSSYINLEYLSLWNISCSDDRRGNISSELDLYNHHKLERLELRNLSDTTVVWPQVTNSCLRGLVITDCNISSELNLHNHHKLEVLVLWNLSVTTILWPQVTNSCLRGLVITDCNNISSELNLHNLHKLEELVLRNLSVTTVVWPQVTNSCLSFLYIDNLKLTHECVEKLCRTTYEQCRWSEMEFCEVRNIFCVDHRTHCNSFEDLQQHIQPVNLQLPYSDGADNGGVDNDNGGVDNDNGGIDNNDNGGVNNDNGGVDNDNGGTDNSDNRGVNNNDNGDVDNDNGDTDNSDNRGVNNNDNGGVDNDNGGVDSDDNGGVNNNDNGGVNNNDNGGVNNNDNGGVNNNDNGGVNNNDNGGVNNNDNGGVNNDNGGVDNDNGGVDSNDNGGTDNSDNRGVNNNDNGDVDSNDNDHNNDLHIDLNWPHSDNSAEDSCCRNFCTHCTLF